MGIIKIYKFVNYYFSSWYSIKKIRKTFKKKKQIFQAYAKILLKNFLYWLLNSKVYKSLKHKIFYQFSEH